MSCRPLDPRAVERLLSGSAAPRLAGGLLLPVPRRRVLRGAGGALATAGVLGLGLPPSAHASDLNEVVQFFVVLVKGLQLVLEAAKLANKIEDEVYKLFDRRDPIVERKQLTSALDDALKGLKPPEAIAVAFNLREQPRGVGLNYLRSEPLGDAPGTPGPAVDPLTPDPALRAFTRTHTEVAVKVDEDLPRMSFKAFPIRSKGTLLPGRRHVTVGELTGTEIYDTAILRVI